MKKYLLGKNFACTLSMAILLALRTFGTIGVAILINYVIDTVAVAIENSTPSLLYTCMVKCSIYALLLGLTVLLSDRIKAMSLRKIMTDVRNDIMHGIMGMDISKFNKENSAHYITVLGQNLSSLEDNYYKNIIAIYTDCIGIIFAIILLFRINPFVAIISLVAMAIPSLIPKLFGKPLGVIQKNIMVQNTSYNKVIKDIFSGYEVIKTYFISDKMLINHQKQSLELEKGKEKFSSEMGLVYGLATMSSVAVQFLIMSLAGIYAVKGIVSIGSIIAITQLTGQVISPAFQLSTKFSHLKSTKPIQSQILSITEEKIADTKLHEMNSSLKLEDVSYAYTDSLVLDSINMDFEFGKKYAIVGESGCGKSTLLKAISGYYGNIKGTSVDGITDSLCDTTMISQNVFLFDDSIKNNITLFGDYCDEEINEAIRIAGLENVINSLDNGLDTCVEENGARFSGGERQRIAIARAILHKKNLLLLDEITSALDNNTARNIEENILALKRTTCISVVHKLVAGVLNKYDKIFVMENGKIVEEGTYDDLMKNGSHFYKYYKMGVA